MSRGTWTLILLLIACSTRSPRVPTSSNPRPVALPPPRTDVPDRTIRVSLAFERPRLSATSDFNVLSADAGPVIAQGRAGEDWPIDPAPRQSVVLQARNGFVTVNGRRFRGDLHVTSGPQVQIVNHVGLEDYLRSVVAVEMGKRPIGDSSALQAQAIASRSFAFVRLGNRGSFDVRASTADQAYGGVDVENELANAAVAATRGLVLRYEGRVVDALYSSTCGGSTAEGSEVFRAASPAYFRRVSDRVPGSTRHYCDIAPRFQWNRTYSRTQLDEVVARYLREYASVPNAGPGGVRHVAIASTTPSGRVGVLDIETERGAFPVRGNDIRYVLRASPGGEMLNSTYFSVEPEYGRDGFLSRVTFRGRGYGHGVGMCQWGAIGRARAGQSFSAILGTYYPGTTIGPAVQ